MDKELMKTDSVGREINISPTNPFANAAIAAVRAVEDMYAKVGFNCFKGDRSQIKTVTMETRTLASQENPFIQFTINNTDAVDHQVIFGSMLGLAGAFARHGQPASACDQVLVLDRLGGRIPTVQGFSESCNYSPVLVTGIQLISASAPQRAQNWRYNDLAYDENVSSVAQNTTASFTRFDNDPTIVKIAGLWYLGPQTNLSILSLAGVSMDIILFLSAVATPRSFKQMGV